MTTLEIRQLVIESLPKLGFEQATPTCETTLLHLGQIAGRRFCYDGVQAVWLAERGTVEFLSDEGERLEIIDIGAPVKKAA